MKPNHINDSICRTNCTIPKTNGRKQAGRRFKILPIWLILLSAAMLIATSNVWAAESGADPEKDVLRATINK